MNTNVTNRSDLVFRFVSISVHSWLKDSYAYVERTLRTPAIKTSAAAICLDKCPGRDRAEPDRLRGAERAELRLAPLRRPDAPACHHAPDRPRPHLQGPQFRPKRPPASHPRDPFPKTLRHRHPRDCRHYRYPILDRAGRRHSRPSYSDIAQKLDSRKPIN